MQIVGVHQYLSVYTVTCFFLQMITWVKVDQVTNEQQFNEQMNLLNLGPRVTNSLLQFNYSKGSPFPSGSPWVHRSLSSLPRCSQAICWLWWFSELLGYPERRKKDLQFRTPFKVICGIVEQLLCGICAFILGTRSLYIVNGTLCPFVVVYL